MSTTDRRKETTHRSSNESTAARTRPYSFEDIMSRRKKKPNPDAKERGNEIRESSEKGHAVGALEHDSDGSPPKKKNSLKNGPRKLEEAISKKKQDHIEGKDKGTSDSEVKMKVKSSYNKSSRDKQSKNEEQYHYRGRTDIRLGSGSEKVSEKKWNEVSVDKDKHEERERKSRKEVKRKYESRIDEKMKSEIDRSVSKKHVSGKLRDAEYKERKGRKKVHSPTYHEESRSKRRRSRSQEYNRERDRSASSSPRAHRNPYDGRGFDESPFQSFKDKSSGSEKVSEKKWNEVSVDKDKHEERERKSRKEEKRKHESHIDEKLKSEIDRSVSKKHDSGKLLDAEYKERKGRKKEHSPTYHEESRPKRRRSRSQEYNRERDRSASSSPRAHRNPYDGRDFDESPFQSFKDKSRGKYSDNGKYRSSGNGGHTSGHYRKHGSGLGGYSPRKRRSGTAVKTPSPTIRSPERKSSTWDQPPAGTSNTDPGSTQFNFQSSTSKMLELVSSTLATPAVTKPRPAPSLDSMKTLINASIDSVQLTQATRPLRRLYVENLLPTASEKLVIDSLNELLLSSHANLIQGAKPCISCIINKEKCQAVVEFLTPEDATAALSLDGRSLSGSVIKIRRPKDFMEAPTGALGNTVPVVKVISDAVKDSPNKIFVGGISKALSSDMFMKIASAFGILKAYHFEFNEELNGPCAFLEYEDQSVTQKARAGLNGMKLGGQVLTAVQALCDSRAEEDDAESPPTYGIPTHAKPLLASTTQVLQLKNLFKLEEFLLLSESDLEEAMEDIRLECARFGTIKSVNVVRCKSSDEVLSEASELQDGNDDSKKIVSGTEGLTNDSEKNEDDNEPPLYKAKDFQDISTGNMKCSDGCHDEIPSKDLNTEACGDGVQVDGVNDPSKFDDQCHDQKIPSTDLMMEDPRDAVRVDGLKDPSIDQPSNCIEVTKMEESICAESGLASEIQLLELDGSLAVHANSRAELSNASIDHMLVETNGGETSDVGGDLQALGDKLDAFEPGCVLVEFSRKESACVAAHCLHGRLYGERVVSVAYVSHDLYVSRFPR